MSQGAGHRWTGISPIGAVNGDVQPVLETVDTLQRVWQEFVAQASPEAFDEARRRSLRRHAIETGIIERLYDVEWGVTEALVAEGLTAEVAAREGGLDPDALDVIRAQYDALTFLVDAVRDGRPLTAFFVRELHEVICQHQATYEATDSLGRPVAAPLHRGSYKVHANHVTRPDGSTLEYAPPEQVEQQLELLLTMHAQARDQHPVSRAAWLHHRFIQIHPFEDGNGRVARALTLLVLLTAQLAPLVVDRLTRAAYIAALDRANDGDLRDLIRLFARLEIVALRSELELPAVVGGLVGSGAVEVARSLAQRLRTLEPVGRQDRSEAVVLLADAMHERVHAYLKRLGGQVNEQFSAVDQQARHSVDHASPPDERSRFWTVQIVRTAREVDFFANVGQGTWWTRLHLTVTRQTLRFVACVQRVGHGESGVLALTVFAEVVPPASEPGDRSLPTVIRRSSPTDSVTLIYGDDPDARWDECAELLDRGLAAALANFVDRLG